MRNKYRSGVYFFEKREESVLAEIMKELQKDFDIPIITSIILFGAFTSSQEQFQNYYFSDTEKPFCKTHISPKIKLLKEKYIQHVAIK